MAEWTEASAAGGRVGWEDRAARSEAIRAGAARLLGVPAADVAFVKNTTEGLSFVANGLEWQPGDRVLVPAREFPSNVYPWVALRDRGVVVEFVEPVGSGGALAVDDFAPALRAVTPRLVAVSWVQYGRGWRTDIEGLAALCHEHGALLCVDAIQGVGVLPCELAAWGVDFAAAGGHKWMLGPEGIGLLYIAEGRRDQIRPPEPGWASVAHREEWGDLDLVWADDARRFEGGMANVAGIFGLGAAIALLLDAGVDAVWRHVDGLCDQLCNGLGRVAGATVLTDRSPGGRSGIVTFTLDAVDAPSVSAQLEAAGIVVSPKGGGVRVSPHGYNTPDDVEALVAAIATMR